MQALLAISRLIDALNDRVGRSVYWLVLLTVLVSAGNAIVRKVFNYSSNAYLELQWYLFSAIFLLCAGYALLNNNHVRIDILAGRLSAKGQAWIDILGTIFFLMPMVCVFIWLSIPWVYETRTDISGSAGGLILWPARILIPIGFVAFYPSQLFLRPSEVTSLIYFSPLIGIGLFALTYWIWTKGVNSYTGTGS